MSRLINMMGAFGLGGMKDPEKPKPYWQILGELNQRDYERENRIEPEVLKPRKTLDPNRKCSKCKRRPAVGKFSRCQTCRDYECQRRRRAEARGDCQACYCKPAVQGFKKCHDCRVSAASSRKKYDQKTKERKNVRR